MDTEDVIDVSSDEEDKPPPKKRKPMPNAMVHIPTNLPGITIKPAQANKSNPFKGISISQSVNKPMKQIITPKSNIVVNPFVNKLGNSIPVHKTGDTVIYRKEIYKPLQNRDYGINPVSINKNSIMSQKKKVLKQNVLKKSLPIKGPTVLNTLPASITIKKATKIKALNVPSTSGLAKKNLSITSKPILKEKGLLTVNLGNEDITISTSSPQWYLRPEEETQKLELALEDSNNEKSESTVNLEEQNNKEPETKNYVEIIIEDSPIKPVEKKQITEIGGELSIIIEDSPYKKKDDSEEKCNEDLVKPDLQSKKKLIYPNDDEDIRQVVEIEIDPVEAIDTLKENKDSENEMSIKNKLEETKRVNDTEEKLEAKSECEFHPTYQAFIDTCFEIENSEDMKKIVEKKIKTYYKQCPKEYVESEEFLDMVSSKIMSMKAGPDKMYLYIKDVVDELNLQRKMAKFYEVKKEPNTNNTTDKKVEVSTEEEIEYDTKRSRQIRKLDKTIKRLHKAIQKLEEQEVDFDDEDDSVFLLTERYKERLVRVHAKFCQMTNTKMPSEPRILIEARPGRPLGPAKKLEKFINKKVPIGTPLPFPDFHDVLRCVQEANDEDRLGWNDMDVKEEARDLFARCGKKLQRRRQENEWRIATSRIPMGMDPADENYDLKQKLNKNKVESAQRENEVFNEYVDKQNQLKLEAEEIGDKEAEESPAESDEEETIEVSSSLEDKHKRKERLKRLLKEKDKKAMDEKVAVILDKQDHAQNVDTNIKNVSDNDKDTGENNRESKAAKSTLDNTPNIDADEQNNNDDNDDKGTENNDFDVDSDIDELHLLEKLRFEDERNSSSSYSSDSDTQIPISDSLESDSDAENEKKPCSDVISIEDSSYSESEILAETEIETLPPIQEINESVKVEIVSNNLETGFSKINNDTAKTNNEDLMENILLGSSEDDVISEKDVILEENGICINLKDNDTEKVKDSKKIYEETKNECEFLDNNKHVFIENLITK